MKERDEVSAVATEIRSYLRKHPRAADSLEGITRWWVSRERFEVARDEVQKALEYLEAQGFVKRVTTASGAVLFGRGRSEDEDPDADETAPE